MDPKAISDRVDLVSRSINRKIFHEWVSAITLRNGKNNATFRFIVNNMDMRSLCSNLAVRTNKSRYPTRIRIALAVITAWSCWAWVSMPSIVLRLEGTRIRRSFPKVRTSTPGYEAALNQIFPGNTTRHLFLQRSLNEWMNPSGTNQRHQIIERLRPDEAVAIVVKRATAAPIEPTHSASPPHSHTSFPELYPDCSIDPLTSVCGETIRCPLPDHFGRGVSRYGGTIDPSATNEPREQQSFLEPPTFVETP